MYLYIYGIITNSFIMIKSLKINFRHILKFIITTYFLIGYRYLLIIN